MPAGVASEGTFADSTTFPVLEAAGLSHRLDGGPQSLPSLSSTRQSPTTSN